MRLVRVAALLVVLVPLGFYAGADVGSKPKSQKVIADRIAAVVGSQVILVSELDLRMVAMRVEVMKIPERSERERRLAKLAVQTLDQMVDDELVLQAARDAKLTVDEAEVQQAVDYIKKEHGLDDQQLAEAMKMQGMSRATLRDDLLRQRAVANFVLPKVSVTDQDVRTRYDQMSRRAASVSAVNVSQILFALPEHPTEQQTTDARKRAQAALDRIRGGEPFGTVATELTDDAGTKTTGGMIGWLEPASLDPAWETVVLGMDKGELRGPISGAKGLYVLYANEVKRTDLGPYDKVKDSLTSQLRQTQLAKLTRTWIEELRKKAYIEIKLS